MKNPRQIGDTVSLWFLFMTYSLTAVVVMVVHIAPVVMVAARVVLSR